MPTTPTPHRPVCGPLRPTLCCSGQHSTTCVSLPTLTDGEAGDYDALLKLIGEARVVLLGVSSQGTHEFFRERAELTTRLITDKGFTAAANGVVRRLRRVEPIRTG
jgi:hypothetical protein